MEIKDSGKRSEFNGGAVRDTSEGKCVWSLVSPFFIRSFYGTFAKQHSKYAITKVFCNVANFQITQDLGYLVNCFHCFGCDLEDMIHHLEKGAEKYSARNWEKGMPITRCIDSLYRHLNALMNDQEDEDHKSAAQCNIMFIVHYIKTIENGGLCPSWNDLPCYNSIED